MPGGGHCLVCVSVPTTTNAAAAAAADDDDGADDRGGGGGEDRAAFDGARPPRSRSVVVAQSRSS